MDKRFMLFKKIGRNYSRKDKNRPRNGETKDQNKRNLDVRRKDKSKMEIGL